MITYVSNFLNYYLDSEWMQNAREYKEHRKISLCALTVSVVASVAMSYLVSLPFLGAAALYGVCHYTLFTSFDEISFKLCADTHKDSGVDKKYIFGGNFILSGVITTLFIEKVCIISLCTPLIAPLGLALAASTGQIVRLLLKNGTDNDYKGWGQCSCLNS